MKTPSDTLFLSAPIGWGIAVAALVLLAWGGRWVARKRADRKRRRDTEATLLDVAAQIANMAQQISARIPAAKTTILSLVTLTGSRSGRKLQEEERHVEELAHRARVLAMGAKEVLDQPAALQSLGEGDLLEHLRLLQGDAKQIRGVWDTLDATVSVLRTSEEAMRRTRAAAASQ